MLRSVTAAGIDSAEHLTAKATPLGSAYNSYALKPTPTSYTLRRISQWTAVPGGP